MHGSVGSGRKNDGKSEGDKQYFVGSSIDVRKWRREKNNKKRQDLYYIDYK